MIAKPSAKLRQSQFSTPMGVRFGCCLTDWVTEAPVSFPDSQDFSVQMHQNPCQWLLARAVPAPDTEELAYPTKFTRERSAPSP